MEWQELFDEVLIDYKDKSMRLHLLISNLLKAR